MSWWYLISLACVVMSGYWAYESFKRNLAFSGWFNLFASALNAAVIMKVLV